MEIDGYILMDHNTGQPAIQGTGYTNLFYGGTYRLTGGCPPSGMFGSGIGREKVYMQATKGKGLSQPWHPEDFGLEWVKDISAS